MKPESQFFKYRAINTGTHQYQEGIGYHKSSGKYRVHLNDYWSPKTKQGQTKQKSVGYYDTIPEATMVWLLAKEQQINRYVRENQGDPETISKLVAFNNHLWSRVYQVLEPTIEETSKPLFFIAIWKRHVYMGYSSDPVQFATKLPMAHTVFYNINDDLSEHLLAYMGQWRILDTHWYMRDIDSLLGILDSVSKGYVSKSVPSYPEVCGPVFKEARVDLIAYTKDREALDHMEGYPELKMRPGGPSFAKVHHYGINDAPYAVAWINADGKRVKDKVYTVWKSMLQRVYTNRQQTYHDATVDTKWLSFMVFRSWYIDQDPQDGDDLDKDLLIPGNKHYGPDTCVLLAHAVNVFIRSNDTAVNVKGYGYVPNRTKPYQARIKVTENGVRKSKYLGDYATKEEAQLAYTKERDTKFKQFINEEKRPNVKQALEHHRQLMWNTLK